MTLRASLFLLATALSGAASPPAGAATPATQEQVDPVYFEVFDAINAGADVDALTNNMLDTLMREMESAPQLGELLKAEPELGTDLRTAIRPILVAYGRDSTVVMRAALGPRLAREISLEDARGIATFFASPVGVRMMQGASRSYDGSATLANIVEKPDAPVTAGELNRDVSTAAAGAIEKMSKEDIAAVAAFGMSPAGQALNRARPVILAVRLEVENRPIPPEYEAKLGAAINTVFEKHFGKP